MNNFDRVAPIYDKLVGIVFGKAMHHAQTKFLKKLARIQGTDPVVGTGWLLAELLSSGPTARYFTLTLQEK